MNNRAKQYYKKMTLTGSLTVDEQWDLLETIFLLEELVLRGPGPVLLPDKVEEPRALTTSSLYDRFEIVQADYRTFAEYPEPPEDYLQVNLIREMAPVLSTFAKFTKISDFASGHRSVGLRAALTVLKAGNYGS
jgi:hypothetical protein